MAGLGFEMFKVGDTVKLEHSAFNGIYKVGKRIGNEISLKKLTSTQIILMNIGNFFSKQWGNALNKLKSWNL